MRVIVVGVACFIAGLWIGAGAIALAGDDAAAPLLRRSDDEVRVDDETADHGGHILVFLVDGVSDGERQGIEATLDALEEVEAYEYWNEEASHVEARRLFSHNPEMLAKLDEGFAVPESYRLLLRVPNGPNATVVASRFDGAPGVLEVVISDPTLQFGE